MSAEASALAEARPLAERLAREGAGSVRAILLYGSRLLGARPDPDSALDLVVIVDDYRRFYAGLSAAGDLHRPVWLVARLANVLPPNVIAFAPDEGRAGLAKCLVASTVHFERALGSDPPDHLLLARMVQRVRTIWSEDRAAEAWVHARLDEAHAGVLTWMAPFLAGTFDAERLGRRMLEVCYGAELRPEAADRAERVSDAQVEHFRRAFGPVLEWAAERGMLRRVDEPDVTGRHATYALSEPAPSRERRRWRRHFRRSKLRATARWLKHTVTFANWLPYLERKVRRRTGREVKLTALERRLPLVFLWPRAIYVLLTRPRREVEPPAEGSTHP